MSPTARLFTDATRRLVAPAPAAAESVVAVPAVPTVLTVTTSLSTSACWPAMKPVTLPTLTLVSPAAAGANTVVPAPAAVPTAATLRASPSTVKASPGFRPEIDASLTLVSPALEGATRVVLSAARVIGRIATGCASRATVTGGRWSAISGVVSVGVVFAVRVARRASRQDEPSSVPAAVQSVGWRRAS